MKNLKKMSNKISSISKQIVFSKMKKEELDIKKN